MMKALLLSLFSIALGPLVSYAEPVQICPNLTFQSEPVPEITDDEKKLLCGDPAIPEWSHLPFEQLKLHLTSMFENRGYLSPTIRLEPNGHITADPGAITYADGIEALSGSPELDISRYQRKVKGEPLTPELIKNIETWIKDAIRRLGYGCPEVEIIGDGARRKIVARIDAGPKSLFTNLRTERVPGLNDQVIRRYYPFREGDAYEPDLLTLASARVSKSNLVFSNHFTISCSDSTRAPSYTHHIVSGPPRMIRVAAGANTELGPVLRAQWGHTRLGERGSNVQLSTYLNFRYQVLTASSDWFFFRDPASRVYAGPELQLKRIDEIRVSYASFRNVIPLKTWVDRGNWKWSFSSGPGSQRILRLGGVGLDRSFHASLISEVELTDHYLELKRGNPDAGTLLNLAIENSVSGVLSRFNAHQFDLRATQFINVGSFLPPEWVLIARARGATTLTDREHDAPELLPISFRQYMGGSRDVRGFGFNEIPRDPAGALTRASAGLEMRIPVPKLSNLYVLALTDAGMVGRQSAQLDPTQYLSPGTGVYWVSPIGVLKGTAARGIIRNSTPETWIQPHWQFFLSFGETI